MMNDRKYYYLIAGLPDIVLEDWKLPFSLRTFVGDLRLHLDPKDFGLVEVLLLANDHKNLLQLLLKKEAPFHTPAVFSRETLEHALQEPEILPMYLQQFLTAFKEQPSDVSAVEWENRLTEVYFEYACSVPNAFLQQWFEMEWQRRNLMAALTARRLHLTLETQVLGSDEIATALRQSKLWDFGLGNQIPFLDDLLQISEAENLLEREKELDWLRWQFIDELNIFNYFSVEVLLGFFLKVQMVERWIQLEEPTGEQLFGQLLAGLENANTFSKEFTL